MASAEEHEMDEEHAIDEAIENAIARRVVRIRRCKVILLVWLYLKQVHSRMLKRRRTQPRAKYSMKAKKATQVEYLKRLTEMSDSDCKNCLRMNRETFRKLVRILRTRCGLADGKYVSVEEKVAMFLTVLGHHTKNRVNKFAFNRSGHTVSVYFHEVLKAVLQLHEVLLATPIPVPADEEMEPWRHFKGCLGALDGTYVSVQVKQMEQTFFRNRKGNIAVNVLGVVDRNMRFIYVLTGWEGSAADGKVLREAVGRENGLKIPIGQYYLVDSGYANAPGFLAPFRGERYHLQEYGTGRRAPQNELEFYNMKHAQARNVVERTFGLWKKRWGILRSPSFYSLFTHNHIILACCLLHNFIRNEAPTDLCEWVVEDEPTMESSDSDCDDGEAEETEQPVDIEYISGVEEADPSWNNVRKVLANLMYNRRRNARANRARH